MAEGCGIAAMPLYTNLDRIERGLAAAGIGPRDPIPPEKLFALDQWHYHGTDAIRAAIEPLGLKPESCVLDIGSGIGGPARYLAHTVGCPVTALELQTPLQASASYLSERPGLADRVSDICRGAVVRRFPDAACEAGGSCFAILHI